MSTIKLSHIDRRLRSKTVRIIRHVAMLWPIRRNLRASTGVGGIRPTYFDDERATRIWLCLGNKM
jgi:hypothetical protein